MGPEIAFPQASLSRPLIYCADLVVTLDGAPLERGFLRVENGLIVEVGRRESLPANPGPVRELGDAVLMPGLINSHCHLELGMARNFASPTSSFSLWVSRLRQFLGACAPEDFVIAARLGALECLKNGITTVVDVGNTGAALEALAHVPLRSFAHVEVLGLDPTEASARLAAAQSLLARNFPPHCQVGPAPHAPYSCSPELLRSLADEARAGRGSGVFTMHVSESAEEDEFFRRGSGPLWNFCERIYPALPPPPGYSGVRYLVENHALPVHALLAHCNTLDAQDISLLREAQASIVHCPKSHAYFNHPEFPLEKCLEAGINICLGTDSLASNEGLSLFDEMAELQRLRPGLPPRVILEMATVNAARALGLSERLGRLKPGYLADFIALGPGASAGDKAYEDLVSEEREVLLVVVGGDEVIRE